MGWAMVISATLVVLVICVLSFFLALTGKPFMIGPPHDKEETSISKREERAEILSPFRLDRPCYKEDPKPSVIP
jgi:hypothetical protein